MAQTLETIIAINATIGNGFADVGNTLTQLGAQVDAISQKLIGFGQDSLDVYKDYEKSMAEAEVALSTRYGRSTRELGNVMTQLNVAATQWASETIFHTDDVANAINEAAHAGWDFDQIMTGIPIAMQLAQAGSMDLSTSLDYLVKSSKAFDVPFQSLGNFVDMWVFAANSSAGNVREFGDAMLKMGSTMRFTDSQEELFSLIGLMHDMGTTGSEAATLLRTSMMNILAPSGVASKTMEMLGATDEEINAIRTDASKLEALNLLESYGFSAFDDKGQAKPILDTYQQLGAVLAQIAGGYENIGKNETTLGVLGTVFGKRGITGALNIINALEQAQTLESQLLNGDAVGYGAYAQATMMDTLYGSVETYESKLERLQQRTGEFLSDQVRPLLDTVGGVIDSISGLDDGPFNAIVAGAEVLAGAGPGLILAGGAFRGIGNIIKLFTTNKYAAGFAAFATAVTGMSEVVAVLHALDEAEYMGQFGNLQLDSSAITGYVDGLTTSFQQAYSEVTNFNQAMQDSVTAYSDVSAAFKGNLITDMLTGVKIEEGSEEYATLQSMGERMIGAVKSGIDNGYQASFASVTQTFINGSSDMDSSMWQQIITAMSVGYEEAIGQAETMGQNLRDALMNALSNDGMVDQGELAGIQSYMDELNRILSEQAEVDSYVQMQQALRKAQTLGLESVEETMAEVSAANQASLDVLRSQHDADYKRAEIGFRRQVENGEITQDQADSLLNTLQQSQRREEYSMTAPQNKAILDTFDLLATESGLGESWSALKDLAGDFREAGGIMTQQAKRDFDASTDAKEAERVSRLLNTAVDTMGGYAELQGYIDAYTAEGNYEMASRYQQIMDMYDVLGNGINVTPEVGMQGQGDYSEIVGTYAQIANLLQGAGTALTPEGLVDYMHQAQDQWQMQPDWYNTLGETLYDQMNAAALNAGFKDITGLISSLEKQLSTAEPQPAEQTVAQETQSQASEQSYQIPFDSSVEPIQYPAELNFTDAGMITFPDSEPAQIPGEVEFENLDAAAADAGPVTMEGELEFGDVELPSVEGLIEGGYGPIPITLEPYMEGTDPLESLQAQGVDVQVNGETTQLTAMIAAEDGQTLTEYIDGDASMLNAAIYAEDGQVLTEIVNGDVGALAAAISSQDGRTVTVRVNYVSTGSVPKGRFATGGRATEASIFGEAGPEWAIPEEHTERTAELLNEAREASGFTWPDLLSRFGGLNANVRNQPTTLVYSPVINAQDVTGVAEALAEDKKRLERWFEEKQLRDQVEVFS